MAPSTKPSATNDASSTDPTAKLTPSQSSSLILTYLRQQNRPYSAIDISANLKNRVTKPAAAKLLKDLHERGEIEGRVAGKGVVYHAVQDEIDPSSIDAQLHILEADTAARRDEIAKLKVEEKEIRLQLRSSTNYTNHHHPSTPSPALLSIKDLHSSITHLSAEKAELETRLATLQEHHNETGKEAVVMIDPAEKERVWTEYKSWGRTLKARRKIRGELWGEVREIVGRGTEGEVKEELGLEF